MSKETRNKGICGSSQGSEESTFTVQFEPDHQYNDKARLIAYLGLKRIGVLRYHLDSSENQSVHVDELAVEPEFRRHGVARRLMQELNNYVRKKYPWIKFKDGDYMSRAMLQLANEIFGKPEYLGDYDKEYTAEYKKAMERLPLIAKSTNDHMLEGPMLYARHKMRGRIPKKQLQPFQP